MSRPRRGVGEHSKHNRYKKGPLVLATAFFTFYPICLAQAATSSFEKSVGLSSPYDLYGYSQQHQVQSKSVSQKSTLPKNYQGLYLQPRLSPSLDRFNTLNTTLTNYQNQLQTLENRKNTNPSAELDIAIRDVESKISDLKTKIDLLNQNISNTRKAETALSNSQVALKSAQDVATIAQASLATAKQALSLQTEATNAANQGVEAAKRTYNESLAKKETSDASLTQQQKVTDQALQTLNERQANAITSSEALNQAQATYNEAQSQLNQAQLALQEAQHNYDTKLIPTPGWTAPTYQKENIRLVPVTTTVTETTQSANILPALDHTIWTGAGTGAQNARPTINGGVLKFSYMQQSVTYIKQENLQGPLTLSVDVKNNDQNRGQQDTYRIELHTYDASGQQNGYAVYNSPTGWHDWTQRQITVDPTSPVASYKVTLTGFDGGYWAGTYGPEMRTPTLSAAITTTTTTTTYTYETYYTTEPLLTEGTIQVQINEGGQATYTAPEGAVFTTSNLRYEAKDRPECGVDIQPNLEGNQITISASNGVWGDPCGGWYKHIIGTISYLGQPTAPLIKDPTLLPPIQEAQTELDNKSAALSSAEQTLNEASLDLDTANSQLTLSQNVYSTESQKSQELQTLNEVLSLEVITNKTSLDNYSQNHEKELENLSIATSNEAQASTALNNAQTKLDEADIINTEAENVYTSLQTSNEALFEVATAAASSAQPSIDSAFAILNKEPEPKPEPEGSPELPTDLSADNLMDVDLTTVDPTELTPEQAEQLVAAALETFETAVEGSPEYEQALDALFLAAQQDDIQVDPALEAIPGVGEAAKAIVAIFNIVGNVGADISPEKRKEAQTLVVTTLVVGQIAQAAAMASASSGSSFRRK